MKEKVKFETPDMVAGNIEKIGVLFLVAITEMGPEDLSLNLTALDMDALYESIVR